MILTHVPTLLTSERILCTRQFGKASGPLDHHGSYYIPQEGGLACARRPIDGEQARSLHQVLNHRIHGELLAEDQRVMILAGPSPEREKCRRKVLEEGLNRLANVDPLGYVQFVV